MQSHYFSLDAPIPGHTPACKAPWRLGVNICICELTKNNTLNAPEMLFLVSGNDGNILPPIFLNKYSTPNATKTKVGMMGMIIRHRDASDSLPLSVKLRGPHDDTHCRCTTTKKPLLLGLSAVPVVKQEDERDEMVEVVPDPSWDGSQGTITAQWWVWKNFHELPMSRLDQDLTQHSTTKTQLVRNVDGSKPCTPSVHPKS